jgi:chromosome partitioning protein
VIFDTSPSVGGLQERAAWAADLVIVPVATEFSSLDSLLKTIAMLRSLHADKGWKGGILGILPTFYDDQTRESRSSLDDLKRQYRSLVLPPIHRATVLRECWAEGQTIFEKDPHCRSALEYQKLVDLIVRY